MKKIISTLLVALFSLSFMLIPASASNFNTIDSAGLLTADEIQALEQLAVDIEADYGYCAMICFTDNINGYDSVYDYGEMLYNNYADCENAIIFVHDLNQNLCDFFIAEDYEEYVFDVNVTDPIFDVYNNAETYYLGAVAFYNGVANALENSGVVENEDTTAPLVVDYADVLTAEEEEYFLERCQTFTDEYKCEIAIVTITDLEGKTAQEYADDFYDYNGYGYGENKDGLLCLYLDGEEGQRNATLTTSGTAQMNIGDDEIEDILLAIAGSTKFGEFKDAFDYFIDMSEDAVKEAATEDVSVTETATQPTEETAVEETAQTITTERTLPLVVDYADVLTAEEKEYFLERCQTFTDEYKCEIAIVTITDLEGKTVQEYADDFYDYNGYGYGENKDGLLLVYLHGEEGQRKAALSTNGTAQMNIGDDEIEDILLAIAGSAKFDEFKDAFDWYIDLTEEAVKPVPPLFWLLICLAVGMVIGLIITNSMASKNYSVHKKETAADYVREGTLMITGRNDVFRNTRVNVTPKPKSNSGKSSDSNGSTHTSSSGRSHGGGSISF